MRRLVLTPTLGTSPHLAESVRAVAAAVPGARHLLVTPESKRVELAGRFPGLECIADSGAGLYSAINLGLAAAGDDWDAFTWINDDDVLVRVASVDAGETGIAYGEVSLIDERGARLGALPVARRAGDLLALLARGIVPLAQPGTWIGREVARRLRGLDESYRLAGDLDFFVRALQAGVRFSFQPGEVARFRLGRGQLSKDEATGLAEKARALQGLGPGRGSWMAVARFRWDNRGVYAERVRRHGLVSMRTLYRRS